MVFRLKLEGNGEFDYRGPTSSFPRGGQPFYVPDIESHVPKPQVPTESIGGVIPSTLIPDRDSLELHIELFLEWQNSFIIFLSRALIDDILTDYDPLNLAADRQLLILSIISVTSRIIGEAGLLPLTVRRGVEFSDLCLLEARTRLMEAAFVKPSIEVVQSACILASREYACGNCNAAWVLNGPYSSRSRLH